MRAIVQSKFGPPSEVLQLAEIERPSINADEVLVRVRATAVHADLWHSVTGRPYSWRVMLGFLAPKRPVPGTDIAGVVESVGARVTRLKPGDEIFGGTMRGFGIGNWGGFAEYAAAPEQSLVLKPTNVTFEQAASVPSSGYIAFANLSGAGANMVGQRVLVNGAGGGLGTIAIPMLKSRGAHVTAVDAGPKLDMLRSIGADETVDYTRTNFAEQGIQYDLILDIASNLSLNECRPALKPTGLFIWIGHEHYGRAGGHILGAGFPKIFRLMVRGIFGDPNLPKMKFPAVIPKLADALAAMSDLMAEGKLIPVVEKEYPLESVADAFRVLEEGKVLGKIVLVL